MKILACLALLSGWQGRAAAQHLRYNSNTGFIESGMPGINFYAPNITSAGTVTAPEFYAGAYFRNSSAGAGLYNSVNALHYHAQASYEWELDGNNSYPVLAFRNGYNGAALGYVYSDGTGFGFLHSGGGWMVYAGNNSDVAVFPGSIQIGTYGGIQPSPTSYGSMALNVVKNTYYGVQFGAAAGQPILMCNNANTACGIYHYNNGGWRDYWVGTTATHYALGDTNANSGVERNVSGWKPVLTKVVTQTHCSSNGYCVSLGCPAGSVTGTVSCSGTICRQECCWGSN